jgi:hypothetical protein
MMGDKYKVLRRAAVFLIFVLIAGCEPTHIQPVLNNIPPPLVFSPQAAMQTGDYAGFLAENSEALQSCQDTDKCTVALFNLSFLYCYPKSPYYDPRQGLKYIQDLIAASPGNPLTFEAMVWKDLLEQNMKKKTTKRPTKRGAVKDNEVPESSSDELAKLPENSRETETSWEVDRRRLEDEISSKEEIIKKLNSQIERSRQIDIEMEKRERGILH